MRQRLLFFQWASFMNRGIENALARLNIFYDTFFYQFQNWEEDDQFCQVFHEKLMETSYDCVLSVNFSPLISNICEEFGIHYIAWVYDAPLHIRNLQCLNNSCNSIYFFDQGQADEYSQQGICAKHLPLAADTELFNCVIGSGECLQPMDISLVGNLYQTEYSYYTAPLDDYLKGYLEGIVNAQMKVYGGYLIPELITEDLLQQMNEVYQSLSDEFQMGSRELEYMLTCEVTGRERYLALALLSAHAAVHVYTKQEDQRLTNVKFHGYADYNTMVPKIFYASRVNLNISLKAIRSGIPLRVIEAAGCGGFVLSNYQSELTEYFRVGEECEIYQDLEDLLEKAVFYLHHEEIRSKIARAGLERVKRDFTFEERLIEMLK